jgi:hypothetical protein
MHGSSLDDRRVRSMNAGGAAALNVALGLIFVYLVFSVAASRINEFVATFLQWRAKGLERALYTMLGGTAPPIKSTGTPMNGTPADPAIGAAAADPLSASTVKNHPVVVAFESTVGKNRKISYLPSRAFSAVVLDILAPTAVIAVDSIPRAGLPPDAVRALDDLRANPNDAQLNAFEKTVPADSPLRETVLPQVRDAISDDVLEQARRTVLRLPDSNPARRLLLRMLADAGSNRDAFRAKLEHWYDDEMSRLTGWYKRRVQRFIIVFGIVLTCAFNVDTITIAQTLWRSPVEQAAAAESAANAAGSSVAEIDSSVGAIKGLAMPLGWTPTHDGTAISDDPRHWPATSFTPWMVKVLGLAITAFALAFGAPFWFDVLGKVARMRNTGGVTSTTDDSRRT